MYIIKVVVRQGNYIVQLHHCAQTDLYLNTLTLLLDLQTRVLSTQS